VVIAIIGGVSAARYLLFDRQTSQTLDVFYLPAVFVAATFLTGYEALAVTLFCLVIIALLTWPDLWRLTTINGSLLLSGAVGALVRRRADQPRRDLESVTELATQVSASLDSRSVLRSIVRVAADLMNAKAASLRLLAADGETLETVAVEGLSAAYLAKGPVLVRRSPLDRRALKGEAVQIADVSKDRRFQYPGAAEREGICSVLCVCLPAPEGAIGVLRVYTAKRRTFRERDVRLLRALASHAALAIAHAHHHEQTLTYMRKVAHELRAPLAAVQSILHVVLEGLTGSVQVRQRELLERAGARTSGLLDLVTDLLQLSRARGEKDAAEIQRVDLGPLAERCAALMAGPATESGLDLHTSISPHLPHVWGSPEQLEEVLTNLLSNAIKYTDPGGRVDLEIAAGEDEVVIRVRDTGIGIPEADQQRVWQEFYRAPNARARTKHSTGLGLAIVKSVAESYGGRVTLESTPAEGTTVEVTLVPAQVVPATHVAPARADEH